MKILPYLALTLMISAVHADDVYNSGTHILTAPVVSVDGKIYTNANVLLGTDGRWSLLSITPPTPAPDSIAETCTSAHINLTNFKRITKGMDLAQVTGIIGCKPDKNVARTDISNLYVWAGYSDGNANTGTFISIQVTFDQNDKNAWSFYSSNL